MLASDTACRNPETGPNFGYAIVGCPLATLGFFWRFFQTEPYLSFPIKSRLAGDPRSSDQLMNGLREAARQVTSENVRSERQSREKRCIGDASERPEPLSPMIRGS